MPTIISNNVTLNFCAFFYCSQTTSPSLGENAPCTPPDTRPVNMYVFQCKLSEVSGHEALWSSGLMLQPQTHQQLLLKQFNNKFTKNEIVTVKRVQCKYNLLLPPQSILFLFCSVFAVICVHLMLQQMFLFFAYKQLQVVSISMKTDLHHYLFDKLFPLLLVA